jgi:hypothetical protein
VAPREITLVELLGPSSHLQMAAAVASFVASVAPYRRRLLKTWYYHERSEKVVKVATFRQNRHAPSLVRVRWRHDGSSRGEPPYPRQPQIVDLVMTMAITSALLRRHLRACSVCQLVYVGVCERVGCV